MPAMTTKHNKYQRSRGQSLIEFALVLPLLLVLILGAMDLGRMFYTKIVLTNTAREGANYLAYFPGDRDNSYANTELIIEAEATSSNVEYSALVVNYLNCCTVGDQVGVSITTTVDLVFGSFLQSLGLINGPLTLTSTTWMVVQ